MLPLPSSPACPYTHHSGIDMSEILSDPELLQMMQVRDSASLVPIVHRRESTSSVRWTSTNETRGIDLVI